MFELDIPKGSEFWDLGRGIEVEMRPLIPGLFAQVHSRLEEQARRMLAGGEVIEGLDISVFEVPTPDTDEKQRAFRDLFFFVALMQVGGIRWEGVAGDLNDCNAAIILLSKSWVYEAFKKEYLVRYGEIVAEGKELAPLPNTVSAGAQDTVKGAPDKNSPVRKGKKVSAEKGVRKSKTASNPAKE